MNKSDILKKIGELLRGEPEKTDKVIVTIRNNIELDIEICSATRRINRTFIIENPPERFDLGKGK